MAGLSLNVSKSSWANILFEYDNGRPPWKIKHVINYAIDYQCTYRLLHGAFVSVFKKKCTSLYYTKTVSEKWYWSEILRNKRGTKLPFLKSCMVLWTLGFNPFDTIVRYTRIYVPDRQGCVVRISHEQHMCKTWILWWRKLTGLL